MLCLGWAVYCHWSEENLEKTMLEKRFTPSWLAGTSIGDLMFQADYYLKELSMGEPLALIRIRVCCMPFGKRRLHLKL